MKTRLMMRVVVCWCVLVPLAMAWGEDACAADRSSSRNILFVAIDDMRDVSSYDPVVQTPNLDRVGEMSMTFDRAYVQATFCNPSRASFLTGLRPQQTGVLDNRTHFRDNVPDVITLPQLFRKSGYDTVRLGKIFHGAASMDDPESWDVAKYPQGTARGKQGERWYPPDKRPGWCWALAAEGTEEDQADGQIAKQAAEFLRGEREKPFFLAVGFHKPHDPFVAPKRYFDLYPRDELQLHETPACASPTPSLQIGGAWKKAFDRFSDDDRRRFLQAYYAATSFMDAQLGKVLDALEEAGLADETIIIVLSDHGYHLGERGWWNKATLYEYSARSPLWMRDPGMKAAGTRYAKPVEFLDIYPTLVELAGLEPPSHLAGRSLAPLLDDPDHSRQAVAYTVLRRGQKLLQAVRTPRWRYINLGPDGERELFDHHADPGDWRNLANEPQYQNTCQELEELLRVQ
ncbi:MAG: sulfatase [Planctomycetota bacterium]